MTRIRIKLAISALILFSTAALIACGDNTPRGVPNFGNAEATYKTRCQTCHLPGATKSFDPSKEDGVLAETILKGRKASRPPMPGFEAEGMTADNARALVAHMKKLRNPAK